MKPDLHFADPYRCHADCSGFLDSLLRHSYGGMPVQFKEWFGHERPTADLYHDAIVKLGAFTQVRDFRKVAPGHVLAVKYKHPKEKSTGHVMLVAGPPKRIKAGPPIKPGAEQWEVPVIDSARSGHGTSDTRHGAGEDGRDRGGLGKGVLRVYTDADGLVVGHTWSVAGARFLSQEEDHLVIGEFNPDAIRANQRSRKARSRSIARIA